MKIACYFNGKSAFGGAERRLGRVMNEVAKQGVEVFFVFTLFEPLEDITRAYNQAIGTDCQIRFVGFYKSSDVYRYTKKERFDFVFYAGAYRYMFPFFLAAKRVHSKTVFLQVTTGPSVGKFDNLLERIEFEFIASHSDRIDCLYPSTLNSIQRKFKRQIVTVTPCPATDLKRFYPVKKERIISFISRWVEGKNIALFLESIISIEDFLYENGYKINLCGKSQDGSVEKNVADLLSTAKHPEIVICPGYIDSQNILPQSEVFMSLQRINNYPSQSLLEAIACGCYIIASDEGDTRCLVKNQFGICSFLNKESIAESIVSFVHLDSKEKERICVEARKFAETNFDLDKSVDHYMKMIEMNE